MKNFKTALFALFATILLTTACEKDEITSFEAKPAVNFTVVSENDYKYNKRYSFLGNTDGEFLMEIPVRIMGNSTNYDRYFNVEIIQDSLSTASENLYEIQKGVVKAGEFDGKLYIIVYNSEELKNEEASLHLRFTNSDDFQAGNKEAVEYTVIWTDKVIVPNWRWYSYFFTRTSSTAAYRAVVESTGYTDFTLNDYRALGPTGAQAVGTQFGDYVKQYNLDHPDAPLLHDDGDMAGEEIVPLYYTHSLYD
ncbi:DUF4843 domain-containing protein [Gillisia sp. M10.2A]|uniref:DUF4843 domain-containing protein n=1 Tax=Gillisia lutea TaxID=2909668 RepID=A0ABS9EF40_9FLAO|nr:DUF4843 domain-containing protein [Gillisia lutea]MCF4100779.1 DUF4843 domain-containing protein [Gillisia lutea]